MTEPGHTLLDLLDEQVRHRPTDTACSDESSSIDYAELARRIATTAEALSIAGVRPGDTAAVFMSPSVDTVVAVWAILASGAGYLPLAVNYPAERIAHMVHDSGATIVVTDEATEVVARQMVRTEVTTVRHEALAVTSLRGDVHAATTTAGNAAYTIYTSGTTGTPKGVTVPHRAIANQLLWLRDHLGLVGARLLFKTPIGFDAAQWEVLANACGATVVVAKAGIHARPGEILDIVDRESIDALQCVPTMWQEVVAHPDVGLARTLRIAVSGGEALSSTLGRDLRARLPSTRLVNLYGPTETTINATAFDFTSADWDGATVPIGVAVAGCATVVVGADDTQALAGQVGELLISGIQLADGYRGRPEVTEERFPTLSIGTRTAQRYYRTGDLVREDADGILEFVGRNDEQVKVNGHRVETNEVRLAIESHDWVRAAAVVPWVTERGNTQLAAFVELDPEQAPLMDQDLAGRHHRSKSTHTQVTAQLANLAARRLDDSATAVPLPGGDASPEQTREVFARKTYRTFSGSPVDVETIRELVVRAARRGGQPSASAPVSLDALGRLLRLLGPFHSADRLLPKYAYASPGALNATQVYVETSGLAGLTDGVHYYDPLHHALNRVGTATRVGVHVHLLGLPEVVESVYATNVAEVLHFEAGHILGVLDRAAARSEWGTTWIDPASSDVDGLPTDGLRTASIRLHPAAATDPLGSERRPRPVPFVQIHADGAGMIPGLYRHAGDRLELISHQRVERRHVIAINQATYADSSFGIVLALGAHAGWTGFVELGRALAHLQQEGAAMNLGLMSAGYSSLSGRDLPSATRFRAILEDATGPTDAGALSYFALGGAVTDEQLESRGMTEDSVHMRGPEELLKDGLRDQLPAEMVPPTVHVMERIPLSRHGKQDRPELVRLASELNTRANRTVEPPNAGAESQIAEVWARVLGYRPVYRSDDFFAQGGNSMSALRLIRALREELDIELPVESIFTTPTVTALAARITSASHLAPGAHRVHRLAGSGDQSTTLLWPGLGGYPMSLRSLAIELAAPGHTVYGVQTRGLNAGERAPTTIDELVDDDVRAILDLGTPEPFRLVGYSFGARVAAEVGRRLVAGGHSVQQVVLIAPGSPVIPAISDPTDVVDYGNRYFTRVLASVFSGRLDPPYLDDLDAVRGRAGFIDLMARTNPEFGRELIERIVRVVERTYHMRSEPVGVESEFLDRSLYLRARGDGPSFADIPMAPLGFRSLPVNNLPYDHYDIITGGALDVASAVLESSMSEVFI